MCRSNQPDKNNNECRRRYSPSIWESISLWFVCRTTWQGTSHEDFILIITSRQICSCIESKNDSNPSCVNEFSSEICTPAGPAQAHLGAFGANAANDVDCSHAKSERKVNFAAGLLRQKPAGKWQNCFSEHNRRELLCAGRYCTCFRLCTYEMSRYCGQVARL